MVKHEWGQSNQDTPAWTTVTVSMDPWAGERVRIVFGAMDAGAPSLIEAGVDDVRITRP
jgi:hypothetical protein